MSRPVASRCAFGISLGVAKPARVLVELRSAIVAIAEHQPHRAIVPQHAAHFTEYLDQPVNILLWRLFKSELPFDSIITQALVRRGSNHGLDRYSFQRPHHFDSVTLYDLPVGHRTNTCHP